MSKRPWDKYSRTRARQRPSARVRLAPLSGELSSREDLHPFNPEALQKDGGIFRGWPILHFARVLKHSRAMPHCLHFLSYFKSVSQNLNKFQTPAMMNKGE
ncbi:MAG: hypothetical protein WAW52_01340 [Methanothrix sp.]